MIKVNGQKVKQAIEAKWPKIKVRFEEEEKEQAFVLDLGDGFTTVFISLCDFFQESDKPVFVFISTGNDEIKDCTVFKKYFDLDSSKTDGENILAMLTESLQTYAHQEYREWKPIIDDLDVMNITDPLEGDYSFQRIEDVTGIPYL